MTTFARILGYSRRYWKQLTLSMVTASFFGLFSAAPSYALKETIDTLFLQNKQHLILPFIGLFMALFSFKGLFMYLSSYYMSWVGNRVINDIRQDLFKKIINFPISFYRKKNSGALMSHFLNDINLIQNASSASIKNGVRSIFETVALFTIALLQNWQLTLLTTLIAPLVSFSFKRMGQSMKKSSTLMQHNMGSLSSQLQEVFVGIREIKVFNSEKIECARFKNGLSSLFTSMMRNAHVEALGPALIEIITMCSTGLVFYIAAHQVMSGRITPGQLTSFFAAMLMAYQPIKRLVTIYADIQNGVAAADRVFELMDSIEPDHCEGTIPFAGFTRAITFNNVSFRYTSHHPIFTNLNITISPGDRIGIVGPSGVGKSTLCDLLLGLIQPTSGSVLIDGVDTSTLAQETLRAHIGYVSQHPFLFNDTVMANVRYAQPHATDEEVVAACKHAYAEEFITKLPQGFNTFVGENGSRLSGGQKQRLTIARALLKKPSIVILDEATSSLDHLSENAICESINQLPRSTTIIVISHRPSLIERMDRIFSIKEHALEEIDPVRFTTTPFQFSDESSLQ